MAANSRPHAFVCVQWMSLHSASPERECVNSNVISCLNAASWSTNLSLFCLGRVTIFAEWIIIVRLFVRCARSFIDSFVDV